MDGWMEECLGGWMGLTVMMDGWMDGCDSNDAIKCKLSDTAPLLSPPSSRP